jgi:tetratricopeptide (TPR) repeat protein
MRRLLLGSSLLLFVLTTFGWAQMEMPGTQIQEVKPITPTAPVSLTLATPEQLEERGDELRESKNYLDAIDYYEAAIKKHPTAILHNKEGMTYLSMGNLSKAQKCIHRSIKMDKHYAEAFNNLGVVFYLRKKYGPAEKNYKKALGLRDSASFHSNLGTVYMERKEFDKGMEEYRKAFDLDPDIFERTSRSGVSARMSSPDDRARFFYFLAKLYASKGVAEKSLLYLEKAMEDGYPDINNVYKDAEFATLRKDQRFTQLMAQRPIPIPQ